MRFAVILLAAFVGTASCSGRPQGRAQVEQQYEWTRRVPAKFEKNEGATGERRLKKLVIPNTCMNKLRGNYEYFVSTNNKIPKKRAVDFCQQEGMEVATFPEEVLLDWRCGVAKALVRPTFVDVRQSRDVELVLVCGGAVDVDPGRSSTGHVACQIRRSGPCKPVVRVETRMVRQIATCRPCQSTETWLKPSSTGTCESRKSPCPEFTSSTGHDESDYESSTVSYQRPCKPRVSESSSVSCRRRGRKPCNSKPPTPCRKNTPCKRADHPRATTARSAQTPKRVKSAAPKDSQKYKKGKSESSSEQDMHGKLCRDQRSSSSVSCPKRSPCKKPCRHPCGKTAAKARVAPPCAKPVKRPCASSRSDTSTSDCTSPRWYRRPNTGKHAHRHH